MTHYPLASRITEQLQSWTRWDRRSWQPGTVLGLRELAEASYYVERGVLSTEAFNWCRTQARARLGTDAGLGVGAIRAQLDGVLKQPFTYASQPRRQLERLTEYLDSSYLEGWRTLEPTEVHTERAARLLSGHLQDIGYSDDYLRKQKSLSSASDYNELIEAASNLASRPMQTYFGIVEIESAPEPQLLTKRTSWIPASDLAEKYRNWGLKLSPSSIGGLSFEKVARDPISAAQQVTADLDRLVNRSRFTRPRKQLTYKPTIRWLDGTTQSLRRKSMSVEVTSMARAQVVYMDFPTSVTLASVDDALELASHLHTATPPTAAANAWAAVESLLTDPSESDKATAGKIVAADRAALITAAAWPRAELTRLSYKIAKRSTDPLLNDVLEQAGDDNHSRCRALVDHWGRVEALDALDAVDRCSVERMGDLVARPKAVTKRVEVYMRDAFRRLYRTRNMVMHGGAIRSVSIDATLRTTGPLVGALLDRLSAGAYTDSIDPLQVTANATTSLFQARETNSILPLIHSRDFN